MKAFEPFTAAELGKLNEGANPVPEFGPDYATVIGRLLATTTRLRRIADYAGHTYYCARSAGGDKPCNCGFDEARR